MPSRSNQPLCVLVTGAAGFPESDRQHRDWGNGNRGPGTLSVVSCKGVPFEGDHSTDIVDEVLQSDFRFCPRDADGAHQTTSERCLLALQTRARSEHALGTFYGLPCLAHWTVDDCAWRAGGCGSPTPGPESPLRFTLREVLVRVQQIVERATVVHAGIYHLIAPDQLVASIDIEMV
jgi:hypothetical protein